jgi:hypothetical protein
MNAKQSCGVCIEVIDGTANKQSATPRHMCISGSKAYAEFGQGMFMRIACVAHPHES